MRLDGSTSSISIVLLDRAVFTSDFDAHFVIFWMHYEKQDVFTAIPASPAIQIQIGSLDSWQLSTQTLSILPEVKLEGAEYEAKRRKELEQAMRKAVGLDMDDPSLDEEVHPAIVVLLRKLKERGGSQNIEGFEVLLGAFYSQKDRFLNGL